MLCADSIRLHIRQLCVHIVTSHCRAARYVLRRLTLRQRPPAARTRCQSCPPVRLPCFSPFSACSCVRIPQIRSAMPLCSARRVDMAGMHHISLNGSSGRVAPLPVRTEPAQSPGVIVAALMSYRKHTDALAPTRLSSSILTIESTWKIISRLIRAPSFCVHCRPTLHKIRSYPRNCAMPYYLSGCQLQYMVRARILPRRSTVRSYSLVSTHWRIRRCARG